MYFTNVVLEMLLTFNLKVTYFNGIIIGYLCQFLKYVKKNELFALVWEMVPTDFIESLTHPASKNTKGITLQPIIIGVKLAAFYYGNLELVLQILIWELCLCKR